MDYKTIQMQDQGILLEKINNAISDSIYIFDLTEGTITWMNKRAQERYGYNLEDLRGLGQKYHSETIHPDDLPRIQAAVVELTQLTDDDVLSLEYRFKDKQGQYHWHNDRITVFSRNEKGEVTAVLGVATNVDKQKETAENQKKSLKNSICLYLRQRWELGSGILKITL